MNLIIKRIILILVFLLPFAIFTRGFYGTVFAKYVFIIITTLLVGSLFLVSKLYKKNTEDIVPRNVVFGVFGIYLLALITSSFSGVLPQLSFWSSFDQGTGTLFMLCLFVLSLITSSVFKKIEDWYKLFTTFAISGIVFSLGGWLSVAGIHFSKFLDLHIKSGFTLGNSSWTGIYLAFVFFISLGLAFSSKIKSQKIIGILGAIILFFDSTLTGFLIQFPGMKFGPIGLAQTASYSMIVGIGIFLLYLIFRKIQSEKIRKIFMTSFLSVAFVGIILISTIGRGYMAELITKKAGPNRLVFWSIAVEGFKEKPILGWGGDAYPYVYGKYFNPIIFTEGYAQEYWVDRSHSFYFDELVTGGALGLLSLLLLYGVMLFGLGRKAVNDRDKNGLLYMALFAGLVSFLIQGLMMFQTIGGWFIIAILLAFVARFCFRDIRNKDVDAGAIEKNKNKKESTDQGFNMFISVVIIILAYILFVYLVSKPYKINRGLSEFPRMSYTERLEFFKKLDNAYIGNNVDLGNAFSPYHVRLRNIFKNGLEDKEKELMINEIKIINNLLEKSSVRQKDMDVKLLMTNVGFYSILAGIAPEQDRQMYYENGMANIDKMIKVSEINPIIRLSKSIMEIAFKYGEEGVNAFDTTKKR